MPADKACVPSVSVSPPIVCVHRPRVLDNGLAQPWHMVDTLSMLR
jgi:hypothetical protein